MKIKILLFSILFFNLSFSQTKKETKEWIVEKYNFYERTNEYSSECDLDFDDAFMVVTMFSKTVRIPIKEIKIIEIKKMRWNSEDQIGWSSIILRYGKDNSQELLLNSEFITEGFQVKMEKAIIHLVKLYGGKATTKKEPF